jgi:UDP-2,3-diacylglucosamine pyrophosphatase LpxH
MRALAISDTHIGAWTGDYLLGHEYAREALAPALDDVDELVLLGDLLDFLFSTVGHAFEEADPLFELIREKLQGRRLTFLAGNHDHHLVLRAREDEMECRIAGDEPRPGYFKRFMDRRLEGVDCRVEYPAHRVGKVLLTHGH